MECLNFQALAAVFSVFSVMLSTFFWCCGRLTAAAGGRRTGLSAPAAGQR